MSCLSLMTVLAAALSLSLDAFAISLCIGACRISVSLSSAFRVGLTCGFFQFFMPLAGWGMGSRFLSVLVRFGPWVAAALLCIVGINMIRESFKEEDCCSRDLTRGWALLSVALATSIDAMALGIGFAVLRQPVGFLALASGIFTLILCLIGVLGGCRMGRWFGSYAQIGGGVVLCLLGLKILRESFL